MDCMKDIARYKSVRTWVWIMTTIFILISGCAHSKKQQEEKSSGLSTEGLAPPIYYDFGDVRLPEELKVIKDDSFVYKTPGFSAGVLVLQGRVEIYSLISFFENSMRNDQWTFVSSFKSSRTIMIFRKMDRHCVINITDRQFSTLVEIWVAPTRGETSAR